MRITARNACAWLILFFAVGAAAQSPPKSLCGRLSERNGLPVLEVWGSREDAAFAAGYFMAEPMIRLVDDFILDPRITVSPQLYETFVRRLAQERFAWSEFEGELRAMLRGVQARLGPDRMGSEKLSRELDVVDLMVVNTVADWFGLLCTSFSAWGGLTTDGGTITARNLDYPSTVDMARAQFVMVYRAESPRKSWVGVTWPGLLGAFSGINEEGVTVLCHDANGKAPSHAEGFTPRGMIFREALEAASASAFEADIRRVLTERRVMVGNNLHASAPRRDGEAPARVFEYDANREGNGITIRTVENGGEALWCTNHVRLRREPEECWRYAKLDEFFGELANRGPKLDAKRAMEAIRSVRQRSTLHSVVVEPNRRVFHVQIASIREDMVEFGLDELLGARANR